MAVFEIPQVFQNLIHKVQQESYIIVAATTLWAYDIVMAFPGEVEMFSRGLGASDLVYLGARLTLSGFVISMVSLVPLIASLTRNDGCQAIVQIAEWFMVLSMILNSLLFVFRVRAVYLNSRKVTVIFGLLWLTTLSQLLPPIASALHISGGDDCDAILEMKPWVVTGFILTAIFDTAVFVAISMQVLGFTGTVHTRKERMLSFLNGKELGRITRAVLQTGQLYYLVTVVVDIFAIFGLVSPWLSDPTRSAFALIGVVLQNITACAVFRLVKLRSIRPGSSVIPTSQEVGTIRFARVVPQSRRSSTSDSDSMLAS